MSFTYLFWWVLFVFTIGFWGFFIYYSYESFDTWYANIFSQCVAYLFTFLTTFFKEEKSSVLMKSSLSVFPFAGQAFGVKS